VDVTTDVTAALDKFKNIETAASTARADVEPSIPDQKVNISDVSCVVDAFGGGSYAFVPSTTNPCP
jgi:hypothetical protein